MNIQRFEAPTAREALALARAAFGDGTLVLSNRQTEGGVEVLAAAESELSSRDVRVPAVTGRLPPARLALSAPAIRTPSVANLPVRAPLVSEASTSEVVRADTEQLAMSTLSFQDYVRERMARRQEAGRGSGASAASPRAASLPVAAPREPAAPVAGAPQAAPPQHNERTVAAAASSATSDFAQTVMNELRGMRQLMEDRFTTLAWLGQARHDAVHSNLMLKFVRAGYSAALARAALEPIAPHTDAQAALQEVMATLEHMLGVDSATPRLTDQGGVFALIGATGVGKTTTIAKLASLGASVHGAASVGLVTLDAHRPGAHEQLRAFGKSMGIVVHPAHDRAVLQELLGLLAAKKMVLIDTAGVAPRDPRRRETLDMLELPGIERVLVLNAGAHGDMLDEVASSFKVGGTMQAILSKVDEAAKLGPALDTVMRHQLRLRGITNGQRVPEDWREPDAAELVRESMQPALRSPFDAGSADLDYYFSPAACSA
ncbi:MAG: flagellar biosynthesis protein FlhF [Burkholderiales bacterium]